MAQSINITELNLPQLEMLKNQLDQVRTGAGASLALQARQPRAAPRRPVGELPFPGNPCPVPAPPPRPGPPRPGPRSPRAPGLTPFPRLL